MNPATAGAAHPGVASVADRVSIRGARSLVMDLLSLTKPRLSSLVVVTAAAGLAAAGSKMSFSSALAILASIWGVVASANAANCYLERDVDVHMLRTRSRPLPSGRLQPAEAAIFSLVLLATSLWCLWWTAGATTVALGVIAWGSYVALYTPLKRRTHWAMHVGTLPGALPPLMGWTAGHGKVALPGLVLFFILVFWQLPHFLAISLFRQPEYQAAGLVNLASVRGEKTAWRHATLCAVACALVGTVPTWIGLTGWKYLLAALPLGVAYSAAAVRGLLVVPEHTGREARGLFGVSLVYLTLVLIALVIDLTPR